MKQMEERRRMQNVIYGYLTSGNSAWDLCQQLTEALYCNSEDPIKEFYDSIVSDLTEARVQSEMETTVEEELDYYIEVAKNNEYSHGSPING